jgi:hypothetical protein
MRRGALVRRAGGAEAEVGVAALEFGVASVGGAAVDVHLS